MPKSPGEVAVDELIEKTMWFLRDNPAIAVAGTALATHLFAAVGSGTPVRKGTSRAALRDWLQNASESMPTRKQFESAAKSAGLPTTYSQLKTKLVSSVEHFCLGPEQSSLPVDNRSCESGCA